MALLVDWKFQTWLSVTGCLVVWMIVLGSLQIAHLTCEEETYDPEVSVKESVLEDLLKNYENKTASGTAARVSNNTLQNALNSVNDATSAIQQGTAAATTPALQDALNSVDVASTTSAIRDVLDSSTPSVQDNLNSSVATMDSSTTSGTEEVQSSSNTSSSTAAPQTPKHTQCKKRFRGVLFFQWVLVAHFLLFIWKITSTAKISNDAIRHDIYSEPYTTTSPLVYSVGVTLVLWSILLFACIKWNGRYQIVLLYIMTVVMAFAVCTWVHNMYGNHLWKHLGHERHYKNIQTWILSQPSTKPSDAVLSGAENAWRSLEENGMVGTSRRESKTACEKQVKEIGQAMDKGDLPKARHLAEACDPSFKETRRVPFVKVLDSDDATADAEAVQKEFRSEREWNALQAQRITNLLRTQMKR